MYALPCATRLAACPPARVFVRPSVRPSLCAAKSCGVFRKTSWDVANFASQACKRLNGRVATYKQEDERASEQAGRQAVFRKQKTWKKTTARWPTLRAPYPFPAILCRTSLSQFSSGAGLLVRYSHHHFGSPSSPCPCPCPRQTNISFKRRGAYISYPVLLSL